MRVAPSNQWLQRHDTGKQGAWWLVLEPTTGPLDRASEIEICSLPNPKLISVGAVGEQALRFEFRKGSHNLAGATCPSSSIHSGVLDDCPTRAEGAASGYEIQQLTLS